MDKRLNSAVAHFIEKVATDMPGLRAAYIFGSYAKNKQRPESDIDIALVLDKIQDEFDLQVQLLILASKFDSRIEPHPITKEDFLTGNPLVAEIKLYGIELEIRGVHA